MSVNKTTCECPSGRQTRAWRRQEGEEETQKKRRSVRKSRRNRKSVRGSERERDKQGELRGVEKA